MWTPGTRMGLGADSSPSGLAGGREGASGPPALHAQGRRMEVQRGQIVRGCGQGVPMLTLSVAFPLQRGRWRSGPHTGRDHHTLIGLMGRSGGALGTYVQCPPHPFSLMGDQGPEWGRDWLKAQTWRPEPASAQGRQDRGPQEVSPRTCGSPRFREKMLTQVNYWVTPLLKI